MVKLYRCKTPTDALCPCGKVHRELVKAGIDVDVERVSLLPRPGKREQIVALTGQAHVPVLVTDDGEAIYPSAEIIARIRAGALGAASASLDERTPEREQL